MQLRQLLKISVAVLCCLLFVFAVAVISYPLFTVAFSVQEVTRQDKPPVAEETVEQPETAKFQIFYIMEEETAEVVSVYAELLNAAADSVFYFEIPVYTKVTLPKELYQQLKAHSPELPQYMKLSNMAENFSDGYRIKGCQSILSEVLGMEAVHWMVLSEEEWRAWKDAVFAEPKTDKEFFLQYAALLAGTESDGSEREGWMYYESYLDAAAKWEGTVPGIEGVGTFEVQKVRTRELFNECLAGPEASGN